MPCPRRPGSEGGQDSASPSQVQATLRHPAASGWRAGRAARSRAGEDLTRFSRTHRSCTVEVSPPLPSSKSGASPCRRPSRRPIWSGMRFAPGKPGLDLSHAENISLAAAAGTGKHASRSCVFHLSSPAPTATPLSPTFPPRTSSSGRTFPPDTANRRRPCSRDVHFQLRRHAFPS